MSWTTCMEQKIEAKYGADAATCVAAGTKEDLNDIVKCIVAVVQDAQEEVILAELTEWSVECAL